MAWLSDEAGMISANCTYGRYVPEIDKLKKTVCRALFSLFWIFTGSTTTDRKLDTCLPVLCIRDKPCCRCSRASLPVFTTGIRLFAASQELTVATSWLGAR